ncbi:T9SS type A sorting domain-containing protein [Chitinophaga oryzae]|uniref:T9SS type A sorting domain-containing protein n=1 Tax=Chitinophaga oryzae TaxID=2725414 RepID=A0ABX6LH47_9BACT|nr:T9SS type A sorting domain-containing protein [Chitinophaga oryzae]QJB39444.1 T9SS type A sorting domain-containing protein [Chitinophaga oryzae]
MNPHLLTGFLLRKMPLLVLFVFLMNTCSYAQKAYVSSQNFQIYGLCVGCAVQNPQNVVGPDESNYASLQIPLGLMGRIEQTLIFPAVKKYTKVVIGIGTNQSGLSAQLLAGVSVETFNGNTSNNDYRIVDSELLNIGISGSGSGRGTIEFATTQPYDRIRISLNAGLLNLNGGLNVYYAYQLDNRIYANRETHKVPKPCTYCDVQNPQNAVGPNENDFSTLNVSASQALYFPAARTFTKLVIGVGSDTKPIEQIRRERALISTINIDENNNPEVVVGLKPDPQDPYRGTIEFMTSQLYHGVSFTLINYANYTADLKIYYAYQDELMLNACKSVLFDPFYYFPFNGNTYSTTPGFYLNASTLFPEYKNDIGCDRGLTSTTAACTLESPDISPSLYTGDITIAFWADIREGDPPVPDPDNPGEYLPPARPQPFLTLEAFGQKFHMTPEHLEVGEEFDGGQIEQRPGYAHYVLVLKADGPATDNACIYINGKPGQGDENCTSWTQEGRSNHKKIKIALDRADIDELVIYNRALSDGEIRLLAHAYPVSPNSAASARTAVSNKMKTVAAKENKKLTISPNPTTGQITLHGNLPLQDAEIIVRSTVGAEVYRSKVRSTVIDLPPTLPGGMYVLTLQTKDKRLFTRKIVLTR